MALNTISIFQPSDIGVGAVIGGEVFNVLVIIGTAMLATPARYLPLRISRSAFFRDIFFYVVSVMMLYHTLKDGQISRAEALRLIAGAVVYSTCVASTSMVRSNCYKWQRRCGLRREKKQYDDGRTSQNSMKSSASLEGQEALRKTKNVAQVFNSTKNVFNSIKGSVPAEATTSTDVELDSDDEEEADEGLREAWEGAGLRADPHEGSVIGVKVEVRNRMMDRSNRAEDRYMWLTDSSLVVSTAISPEFPIQRRGRANDNCVYDAQARMWHHGGIISIPDELEEVTGNSGSSLGRSLVRSISGSQIPDGAGIEGLQDVPFETIPLKDVLYCNPVPGDPTMFTLHIHQNDPSVLQLGRLITVEFYCKNEHVHDEWVKALTEDLKNRRYHLGQSADHPPEPDKCSDVLWDWVKWFQFPVKSLAKNSIPDMDKPELQHWYPVAFTMSMVWLAIFAYLVVSACTGIHEDFGIPTGLLGFTIAAAGTSFPNVFAGMVVSRQGKTTMAIANALGANVQNVFLALAVPWTIKTCLINHGDFPMPVQGLLAQTLAIYITLVPVVLIFVCSGMVLPRWSGRVFLITYLFYLVIALGEQSTGCTEWPFPCPQTGR
jgi:Ca2+/Na+ antiporter